VLSTLYVIDFILSIAYKIEFKIFVTSAAVGWTGFVLVQPSINAPSAIFGIAAWTSSFGKP